MNDFDFRLIAPRCGSHADAFEELCCQLAYRTLPDNISYKRLRGSGGDGGVECYADLPDGTRVGWQAKYVFDVDSLLTQTTKSITTAIAIHKTLARYIVCFPFDLSGPTGRKGKSGYEKFEAWRKKHERQRKAKRPSLLIEAWPESKLRSLLLEHDVAGGIRQFFFDATILSDDWFSVHLDSAIRTAGPRYTPELNVKTDLWKWFSAFGRTAEWVESLNEVLRSSRLTYDRLASAVKTKRSDPSVPLWPANLQHDAESAVSDMLTLLHESADLPKTVNGDQLRLVRDKANRLLNRLTSLEARLVEDLETQYGPGRADSRGFRQFMAEYNVSFPTANLDTVREGIKALEDLTSWLNSPACFLSFERAFVLTGIAGSGKTHGICDIAERRLREGKLSCVVFGHGFGGMPDPWTRLLEVLGLPLTIGRDGLLDALNAAGEASGCPLVLFIDAINETKPLGYWPSHLAALAQQVRRRKFLRLCITCRTSFGSHCLPDGHTFSVIEHEGFKGIERVACQAFFEHYTLKPPITPILQPELSNPLYLRLVCETLRARDLDRIPSGWAGFSPTIRAFIGEKERQFAKEHGTRIGAHIIGGSLRTIARAIADSGASAIAWSDAQKLISEERPQASTLPVLEWLVRADLLIEDITGDADPLGTQGVVRPSFERLGDFLIADELLDGIDSKQLSAACKPGGVLHSLLRDQSTVTQNSGVVSALSILIPEGSSGTEFPGLLDDRSVRSAVLDITVASFPFRDPKTFSTASQSLIREALRSKHISRKAMNAALSISWQPSSIDAIWIDALLKEAPLARRDAFWCSFLHDSYEKSGSVRRLISAAFELPLDQVEPSIGERWATILLWFTAAADRRIKDTAVRAATALFTARPEVLPAVTKRIILCDDDKVRERALLSSYGALIVAHDAEMAGIIARTLRSVYRRDPASFDNAMIRDHVRCIAELARTLGTLPENYDPEFTVESLNSEWPLIEPSEEEVNRLDDVLPKLAYSCLHDDFFTYSMNCLKPWDHSVTKQHMAKWILQRAASEFRYEGSGCEHYDECMLAKYGAGRGREMWAERIGKKYQWIGLYQLASRLHDHVERKYDSWDPRPQRTPFILLEERKLDPTLPPNMSGREREERAWWIGDSANLESGKELSAKDWINKRDDLPQLDRLLAPQLHQNEQWRLLVTRPSWGRPDKDAPNKPYRQVWIHLESFLVSKRRVTAVYDSLHGRNLFGGWMPRGGTWLYGFAGEYPWATPFNMNAKESNGSRKGDKDILDALTPSWSELAVEWEYDASLPRYLHMLMPARDFFSHKDLWWDGRGGQLCKKNVVFRDPSVVENGPAALIADANDLLERLDRLGMHLIWTLLGEKWILGGVREESRPICTFSQIARSEKDGSIKFGDRVFFDDYDKDTGPKKIKRPRGRKAEGTPASAVEHNVVPSECIIARAGAEVAPSIAGRRIARIDSSPSERIGTNLSS
ncbi:MAG: hypothetical protein NW701_17410 [Nitrospira sp.]